MDFIEVEILNWEKYNPRRDYKKPWWFALSNTICTDPMFVEFSDAEFRAWIYILCTASVQNTNRCQLFHKHAERSAGIKRKILISTIGKLEILQVIRIPAGICTDSVRDLYATEQNRTEQNTPVRDLYATDLNTQKSDSKESPSPQLIWNREIKSLPQVKQWTKARQAQIRKHAFTDEQWTELFRKVEASDFLTGRTKTDGRKWKASFDWVLKSANLTKVLEGNYDNPNKRTVYVL